MESESNSDFSHSNSGVWLGKAIKATTEQGAGRSSVHNRMISFETLKFSRHSDLFDIKAENEEERKLHIAATQIQRFFRKISVSRTQVQFRQRLRQCFLQLEETSENKNSEAAQRQAHEIKSKVHALTPGLIHWFLRTKGVSAANPGSTHILHGVVVYIFVSGLTEFARQVNQVKKVGDVSAVWNGQLQPIEDQTGTESLGAIECQSNLNSDVIMRCWDMIIGKIHHFQGDVVKILDDVVQVTFPVDILFSSVKKHATARSMCQSRALLFCLDLIERLRTFEIDKNVLAKDHVRLRIGLAYGEMKFHIVRSLMRSELLVSGEAADEAATLCDKAVDTEVLAHKSIGDIKDRIVLSSNFVRLRMDGSQPSTHLLYERLIVSKDYISLSQTDDPYHHNVAPRTRGGRKRSVDALPSHESFAKIGMTASFKIVETRSYHTESGISFSQSSDSMMNESHESSILRVPSQNSFTANAAMTIATFIPNRVFSSIVLGAFVAQLERAFCTVVTIVVPGVARYGSDCDTDSMQEIVSIVDAIVKNQLGDLLQVWTDSRGFVIVAIFGNLSAQAEHMGTTAAREIALELHHMGFESAIGVASGFCKVGLIGALTRFTYSSIGDVPRLSARLASRASSTQLEKFQRPIILVDQTTFLGLPPHENQKFLVFELYVRGFEDNVQTFLPLYYKETLEDLEKHKVLADLAIIGSHKIVKVTDASEEAHRRAKWQRQEGGFVADVSRLSLGLEHSDAVQAVLKLLAIMGTVSARVDTQIVQAMFAESTTAAHLEYSLNVLRSSLQIIRFVGQNVYMINNVQGQIKPIYASLMPTYRMKLHGLLANIYAEKMSIGEITDIPQHTLQIMIGTHYSQAGVECHQEAATYLNQAITAVSYETPAQGVALAKRSYNLTRSWQNFQHSRAETTSAQAQFLIAKFQRKMGNLQSSFNAFVACLRSFTALEPLLHPPCTNLETCEYLKESLESCSCYSLPKNLRVYLFIHHAPDPFSEFQFRCLEISTASDVFLVNAVECIINGSFEKRPSPTANCKLVELSNSELERHYSVFNRNPNVRKYYQVLIMNRHTSKYILKSFLQLAAISIKAKAAEYIRTSFAPATSSSSIFSPKEPVKIKSNMCLLQ